MFKRLLPVFLVPVLLAGVAMARPAGATGTGHSQGVVLSKSQFSPRDNDPRFDFGTVVRDTADELSVGPDKWQVPREVSPWTSFFSWGWFSLLISR
jgi:hypothetical protein